MTLESQVGETPAQVTQEKPESMTIDEMIESRREERAAAQEVETEAEDVETETEALDNEAQEAAGVVEGDEQTEAVETEDETEIEYEEVEAETPSIDPPQFYDAQMREHFTGLDPVSQANIVQLTKRGEAFVTQSAQRARDEVRSAVQTKLEQFDGAIEYAESFGAKKFASDDELTQLLNAGQATSEQVLQHQMERRQFEGSVNQMKAARDEEDKGWVQDNIKSRAESLTQRNPKVLEDARDVVAFANAQGRSSDDLDRASATDLETLWKAMQWDKSQKAAKSVKRVPKRPAKAIKPSRAGKGASPQSAEIARLTKRANETGSIEDITALRRAKRKSAK